MLARHLKALIASFAILFAAYSQAAQSNQVIYADGLSTGWSDGSWATVNMNNTSPVHAGTKSISVHCQSNDYEGLFFIHNNFDTSPYTAISFYIYATVGGPQQLQVQGTVNYDGQTPFFQVPSLTASNWTLITVPLSAINSSNVPNLDGFWIQSQSGSALPIFYVDDVTLIGNTNVVTNSPPGLNATASITVDAAANRHPISPQIYGVAFATSNELTDLNFTMNRSGGNNETRYNWQTNAHNLDNDYYFESYPDGSAVAGESADSFVTDSKNGGAQPMITIPMIGWAPKLGPNRTILPSYSVAKYGPQTSVDQYLTNAGNGVAIGGTLITNNDPNDANFPVDVGFQQGYVQHLIGKWGTSTNGGVKYYFMDNEHSLWYSTHQDIHPVGTTMQEIYTNMILYGSMVKSNDPNAIVLGPEEWGWPGYFYSGYDQQWSNTRTNYNSSQFPDRGSNGGTDYIPWLLTHIRQHDTNTGKRILDYLTVHCYPQEGNVGSQTDVSTATQLLRNQTTRQFWDPTYTDPSWIASVIDLIPLLQGWVTNYYPGTKIGITEYNWGAENFINGATAQADILGIFGRQSLDLATRWTTPDATTPTYLAMKMYRNYDGQKSTFGDTSVSATGPNPDNVAVFAATRSVDSALTLMVVSKYLSNSTPVSVTVSNFLTPGPAQVWQLNSSNAITHLSNAAISNGTVSLTVPGQSITLLVLPAVTNSIISGITRTNGQLKFSFTAEIGQTWILQSSSNLTTWSPVLTNTFATTQTNFSVTTGASRMFYRMRQGP